MIRIGIVGWYGTETLGDIAILDGIFKVFRELDKELEVYIGSLFPFHTNRNILENDCCYSLGFAKIEFSVFDVRCKREVDSVIKNVDIIVLGGGPLMNLEELFPIMKVFMRSYNYGIPTIVMGCGVGPLDKREYVNVVAEIFRYSNEICLRDKQSVSLAEELLGNKFDYKYIGDPAVISIEDYCRTNEIHREKSIVINLREFPKTEYGERGAFSLLCASKIIQDISDEFEHVIMVPMHTFDIGGDDRHYLATISGMVDRDNITVLHKPLSLPELYKVYADAYGTIGMRYHSVVMQTILNGNNYVVNYTDTKFGKTVGFIENEDASEFYANRMCNLKNGDDLDSNKIITALKSNKRFIHSQTCMKEEYVKIIRRMLKDKLKNGK